MVKYVKYITNLPLMSICMAHDAISINWANGPLRISKVNVEFGEVQGPLKTVLQIKGCRV